VAVEIEAVNLMKEVASAAAMGTVSAYLDTYFWQE
jgi:hypothetical protein